MQDDDENEDELLEQIAESHHLSRRSYWKSWKRNWTSSKHRVAVIGRIVKSLLLVNQLILKTMIFSACGCRASTMSAATRLLPSLPVRLQPCTSNRPDEFGSNFANSGVTRGHGRGILPHRS